MIVQKYLVQQGICSRQEAETLLRAGHILVNGQPAVPGVPLLATDVVTLTAAAEMQLAAKITVAIYKPRGVTCSLAKNEGRNVFNVFPQWRELHMVGRLDKESEGLLLLSNDGLVTKRVTGDTHETEKEYEITTKERVVARQLRPFETGVTLSDGPTLPAQVEIVDSHIFRIVLREGRNRQIRRMCGKVGLTVLSLKRVRIGPLPLGALQPGQSRQLSDSEVRSLKEV